MFKRSVSPTSPTIRLVALGALLVTSACASSDAGDGEDSAVTSASETAGTAASTTATTAVTDTASSDTTSSDTTSSDTTSSETTADTESADTEPAAGDAADGAVGCEETAALFVTRGSANADLDDPEVSASCDGDTVIVTSNGIPDYTYIETSPGQPRDQDNTFVIPATPTIADTVTDIPLLGTAAVSLGGIQIFGPTEGTGGDVESLPGILSDCGSHNGPSGFHIHLILTSAETDCLFTPDEVAAEPQLVGYAFDGFPIYTGIDQYNGRTDDDGNYAYYTTATFPYILGCYAGVVDLEAAGGGGGGGRGEAGGERPERPDGGGDTEGDRPVRPEGEGASPEGGGEVGDDE
jgi:hypothetical protein